jgi:putative endonuclease
MTRTTDSPNVADSGTSGTSSQTGSSTGRQRQALGAYGEDVALRHLTELGMVVLERNWTCPDGEVDLVLRDGDVLVICEVKTRGTAGCGTPHEALTADKVARLRRLAARWVSERGVRPREIRLDFVAVWHPRRGAARVEHVPGVG